MLKFLAVIAVAFAGVLVAAGVTLATTITLPLNFVFSGSTPPCPSPWGTATFEDVTTNTVRLTLKVNLTGPGCTQAFISKWYFNLNPDLDPALLSFTFVEQTGTFTLLGISTGRDFDQADGDGLFDIRFDFATGPPGNRFDNTDQVIYDITYPGPPGTLTALSFDFGSTPGGGRGTFRTAAHLQGLGIDAEESGWAGDGPPPRKASEPGSLALMGTALAGVLTAGLRRRRRA